MRKGLLAALLVAALLVAVGVASGVVVFERGRVAGSPSDSELSFKEFNVGQLMHFQLEVDPATSGRPISSPQLTLIEERTSQIRQLPLKKKVPFIEAGENIIRFQMVEEFNQEMPEEEVEADQVLLQELGLFPRDQNLEQVLTNVYTEQIAGSYDTQDKVITIVAAKGTTSAMDDLTISHETTHALQDQNYGLDKPPLENDAYNGDNDLAVTSLIEGDATLEMVEYGREFLSVSQLQELGSQEVSSEQLDKAPLYIRKSILFPYEEGFTFVQQLALGGNKAIDRALTDPPLSTEQILHPDKYIKTPRDNPRTVPLADISSSLGSGWKKTNEDCMGEFDVNTWFEEYVKGGNKAAGAGWGGNTIQLYEGPGSKRVVVNDFVWDTTKDAFEFYDGYRGLLKGRFGSGATEVGHKANAFLIKAGGQLFYCAEVGDNTLALQAPDQATLNAALKNYPGFPTIP